MGCLKNYSLEVFKDRRKFLYIINPGDHSIFSLKLCTLLYYSE